MRDSEIEWSYLCTPGTTRKHKEWPDTPSPRDPLHRSDVRWTTDQMLNWMARFGGNAEGGGGGVLRPLFIWYPAIIGAGKKPQSGTTKWMPWSLSQSHPSLLCWRRRNYILKVGMTRVFILQRNNVQHKSWLWWSRTQECLTLAVCATFQRRMCNLLN